MYAVRKRFGTKLPDTKEAEAKFRKVRLPGSYISQKIPSTPSTSVARKRIRISTPKKIVFSPNPTKIKSRPNKIEKITLTVNNTNVGQAVNHISQSKYKKGFKQLFHSSKAAKKAAVEVIGNIVRDEITGYTKKVATRVNTGLKELFEFSWFNQLTNARKSCPCLLELVIASITKKKCQKTITRMRGGKHISLIPVVGTLLSIITNTRNRRSNVLQQMNSVMLWLGGCKRKVFDAFNKLGMCVGIGATRNQIDKFRQDYDKKVLKWKEEISSLNLVQTEEVEENLVDLNDIWEDADDDEIEEDTNESSTTDEGNTDPEFEENSETQEEQSSSEDLSSNALEGELDNDDFIPVYDASATYYFDITFDNVNQKIGVRHHVRGKENKMFNMVQAFATRDRIPVAGLSNYMPSADVIRDIPINVYVPNLYEETSLKEELAVMVSRILCRYITCFKNLHLDLKIPHPYSKESNYKSEIVPLGIIQKDETKTGEMIEILDIYKQYAPEDINGEPVPLILYCDGLSCERVDGAQNARINGADKWTRLEMFEPAIQEWHKRLIYIQDTYDELFKFDSHRERGTLYHIKQYFDHKGVSANMMDCFNKAEELLELATNGYTITAALSVMGIQDIESIPKDFPTSSSEIAEYLTKICNDVVNMVYEKPNSEEIINVKIDKTCKPSLYCHCKIDVGGTMVYCNNSKCDKGTWFHIECIGMLEEDVPDGSWYCCEFCKVAATTKRLGKKSNVADRFRDMQKEYAQRLLWRGLNDLARKDAVKENDGLRMIRHWKFDILDFYEKNHPKYLIYAHRLLTNIAGGTSERLQHQLVWNRTVNVHGGKGKNIPKDLYNEHLNKEYKENSRDARGQLTDATIARHSQMLGVGKALEKVYYEEIAVKAHHTRKHGNVDNDADVRRLVELLIPLKLFQSTPGRSFKGFDNIKKGRGVSQPKRFKERLYRYQEKLAIKRELQDMN